MKQKAKPKAARPAAAKKPARRGAVSAKTKPKSRPATAAKKPRTKAKAAPARKAARKNAPKKTSAKRPAARPKQRSKARQDQAATWSSEAFGASENQFLAEFEAATGPVHHEVTPAAELTEAVALRQGARRGPHGEAEPESGETPTQVNKLVPTNAVHTTKRRMKRNTWQSPVLGSAAVAVVLGVLVLGHESAPPDVSPLERRAEATWGDQRHLTDPLQAAPERALETPAVVGRPEVPRWSDQANTPPQSQAEAPGGLKVLDLVEMERMLARLEMGPSQPDGVVDQQTTSAIRMYQQIAGLPVDGEPSMELLDDMREVVKMLDGAN